MLIYIKIICISGSADFKKSIKTKKYTVTLKVNEKAFAGKKVTLKVNGKTYMATTNKKSQATLKFSN